MPDTEPVQYAELIREPHPPNLPWWLHWMWGCDWKQPPSTWCNSCFYRAWRRLHMDGDAG